MLLWKWKTNRKCLSYSLLSGMKLQIHRSSIKWFFLDIVPWSREEDQNLFWHTGLLLFTFFTVGNSFSPIKNSNFTSEKNNFNLYLKILENQNINIVALFEQLLSSEELETGWDSLNLPLLWSMLILGTHICFYLFLATILFKMLTW